MIGLEIDSEALEIARGNIEHYELQSHIDLVQCDITKLQSNSHMKDYFDTVIMNPPFGTKNNEGIDMQLLTAAVYVRNFDESTSLTFIGLQRSSVLSAQGINIKIHTKIRKRQTGLQGRATPKN